MWERHRSTDSKSRQGGDSRYDEDRAAVAAFQALLEAELTKRKVSASPIPLGCRDSEQGLTDRHTTRKRILSGCGAQSDEKQKGGEAAA